MKDQSLNLSQITQVCVSIILMCIGILLFTNVLDANDPRYWLAAVLVLAGVFTTTISPAVAFVLTALGGYLLLRDFGVIDTPWVGYLVSLLLVGAGVYGIFASIKTRRRIAAESKADEPNL